MATNGRETVARQADRLQWLLDLVQADTLALFNAAEDKPSEFALLDFCHILGEAETAVRRRFEAVSSGR